MLVTGNPAEVRGAVSAHLDRQRERLAGAPTSGGGPGSRPRAGLRAPLNGEIRRAVQRHGTAFVE